MDLLPMDIGPLNPVVGELAVAAVLFALVFLCFVRLVPRIQRVLDEREAATKGTEAQAEALQEEARIKRAEVAAALADARHEAARIRQRAYEEGAALITEARADGSREYTTLLAEGRARLTAARTSAEAELRLHVAELASNLAARIIGEPIEEKTRARP
ncbi:ATP synthase subunit beta [Streptomyces scabiei]|uniref:F0F1 ATP synthase subunit B family protein n=1 Tax=Streptomyces scabiei TaxID=1930 RepID=UPI0004E6A47C|nr:ATP synthase subunit beta [Streptomyces scabiei]KFF95878.1 ATP synthase subunit beta [Streptomyces scabiei]